MGPYKEVFRGLTRLLRSLPEYHESRTNTSRQNWIFGWVSAFRIIVIFCSPSCRFCSISVPLLFRFCSEQLRFSNSARTYSLRFRACFFLLQLFSVVSRCDCDGLRFWESVIIWQLFIGFGCRGLISHYWGYWGVRGRGYSLSLTIPLTALWEGGRSPVKTLCNHFLFYLPWALLAVFPKLFL